MKRILAFLLASLMLLPTVLMIGCSNDEEVTVLRICNCEDYIDETLFDDFYEETGIVIEYSTYGTNENLYNELVINPNSYDLVVPSEYMIENLAVEGRLNKLDFSKIPSYKENVSKFIDQKLSDKIFTVTQGEYKGENLSISDFMVGYMWGTMGWVYNTEFVTEEDVNSWASPFENKSLTKKITIKDSVRDSYLVGLAMESEQELRNATSNAQVTEILNRVDKDTISKVGERLNALRPMLYGFEVDSGKNDIVLGNIYAYVAWSGDAGYAIDVAEGKIEDDDGEFVTTLRDLDYYIPDEGGNIWFDGFVMPSGSNNYDAVYKFLDFVSRPENAARNMDAVCYTSMIKSQEIFDYFVVDNYDASESLDAEDLITVDLSYFFGDDGDFTVQVAKSEYGRLIAQYPELKHVEKCAIMSYFNGETLMDINEMWESVKGETMQTWILIVLASIVVVVAILIVLIRNRDKIKWLKLPERKSTYAQRKGHKLIKKEKLN